LKRISKIPVTIITGFLGAGKTTLINSLLHKNAGIQFALVENEFGEVAIDTRLIRGVDTGQLFELKQGCICCTISDEYELVLQELAERFPDVDHLLIETTGIADPAPVIRPFFSDKNLQELYRYNGTICLLDAVNFDAQPEKEISLKQLAIADLVLVSKSENNSIEQKQNRQNEIQKINPFAEVQFSTFGKADFQLDTIQTKSRSEFDFVSLKSSHSHIQTKTLSFQQALNKTEFLRWLEYVLDIYKTQIYRCKGIVCFQDEPFEYIIQGIGGAFELEEGDLILDACKSEVVFIGKLENVLLDFKN
jgi:G3E family GTPase